jgi:hypothetical protein
VTIGAQLFGLQNVFQTGLELVSGSSRIPPVFSMQGSMEKLSMG